MFMIFSERGRLKTELAVAVARARGSHTVTVFGRAGYLSLIVTVIRGTFGTVHTRFEVFRHGSCSR
jgi:hypothetical protein